MKEQDNQRSQKKKTMRIYVVRSSWIYIHGKGVEINMIIKQVCCGI